MLLLQQPGSSQLRARGSLTLLLQLPMSNLIATQGLASMLLLQLQGQCNLQPEVSWVLMLQLPWSSQ